MFWDWIQAISCFIRRFCVFRRWNITVPAELRNPLTEMMNSWHYRGSVLAQTVNCKTPQNTPGFPLVKLSELWQVFFTVNSRCSWSQICSAFWRGANEERKNISVATDSRDGRGEELSLLRLMCEEYFINRTLEEGLQDSICITKFLASLEQCWVSASIGISSVLQRNICSFPVMYEHAWHSDGWF